MSDLISRQAVIDEILRLTRYETVRDLYEATVAYKYDDYQDGIMDAIDAVIGVDVPEEQPTVEERKTGRWIEEPGMLMCSQCGDVWGWNDAEMVVNFNFCPYCGAKMDEVSKDE